LSFLLAFFVFHASHELIHILLLLAKGKMGCTFNPPYMDGLGPAPLKKRKEEKNIGPSANPNQPV
jgi:hypothetical protein